MGFISPKYSIRLYTQASAVRKNNPDAIGRIHTIAVRNRLPFSKLREKPVSSLILIPAPPIGYAGIMRHFMKIILPYRHLGFCRTDSIREFQMPENSATSVRSQ